MAVVETKERKNGFILVCRVHAYSINTLNYPLVFSSSINTTLVYLKLQLPMASII
jgi:hypothetical protein